MNAANLFGGPQVQHYHQAIAVVVASIRPYTAVAFAVLAPMLGLGAMAMWGARHGDFPPRDDDVATGRNTPGTPR